MTLAPVDPERSLAIRAARLYHASGLTQAAVAKRLGVTSVKAHRLIARAVAEGAVKVMVEGRIVECAALEAALCDRFGLDTCEVAPDLAELGLPLRAGHGRSALPAPRDRAWRASRDRTGARAHAVGCRGPVATHRCGRGALRVAAGGVTRNCAANPHDVMHRLAGKTSAQACVMPVLFFANSARDREILLAQKGVREVFAMSNAAGLKIVGIGTVEPDAQLVASGMIEPHEIEGIAASGGAGEMLGHFFDPDGRVVETALTARTLSVSLAGHGRIVAIAGGAAKVAAIRAVLTNRRLAGLITDEPTARALIG